jgi:lactate dehydrogenase-like 2-hydroxyacid dehydrogenase
LALELTIFTFRAKTFGLRVVFQDPNIEDGVEKSLGVSRVDTLKELIEESDILSLNCWLDSTNSHLINKYRVGFFLTICRESLSWIKPSGIYFVNTARGGLVDESALLEALKGMFETNPSLLLQTEELKGQPWTSQR